MLDKKTYVVVGLGGSGLCAAKYLTEQGARVIATDANANPALAVQLPDSVERQFGEISPHVLTAADCVVISPGVDPRIEAVVAAKQAGIPVVSDVQLFIDALKDRDVKRGTSTPIIAITGSNAKSTVTTLVGEMAKQAGLIVGVGGNIGTPALELLKIEAMQLVVLELSSFQLEHISQLGAASAAILNLSADHLDRHEGMQDYLNQKLRILQDVKSAIICQDDAQLMTACQQALSANAQPANCIYTSGVIDNSDADFYLANQEAGLMLCHQGEALLNTDQLKIKGKHNLLNALSALALGQAVDLPMSAMLAALEQFKGLPHRCEYVDEVSGKAYFNDSKGTNIGSTLAAIDGLGAVYGEASLAVILGGQGKGQDFSELSAEVSKWADSVYLIGTDAQLIEQGLLAGDATIAEKIVHCQTLEQAVQAASQSSAKAVLLSPACASLDQFKSYAQRGEVFVSLVRALA